MSLRVNLLRQEEYRYQGPVSLRLVMVLCGSLLGAGALLFIAFAMQNYFSLRSNMNSAQSEWQAIETRYNAVTTEQKNLLANQALIGELNLWTKTRPSWSSLLPSLQQIVPASVQLTRFAVRSEWQYIKPLPPATSAQPEGTPPPAPREIPSIPARKSFISTEGRARGELADETVVQFVRTLREEAVYQPLLESVKLQRLMREVGQNEGAEADRIFEIQGEFFMRKLE